MPTDSLSKISERASASSAAPPTTLRPNRARHEHLEQLSDIRVQVRSTPPQTRRGVLFLLTRMASALVLTLPALIGALLAWWEQGVFDVRSMLVTVVGVWSTVAGINVLGEYIDYRYTLRPEAKYLGRSFPISGASLITQGAFSGRAALTLSLTWIGVGILCMLWLVYVAGWPVLFFMVLSLVLLYLSLAPPMPHHLQWGGGELCMFLSIGLLQVLNGYYVQAQTLTVLPLGVSIPLGLFAALVTFTYTFVHRRRDWLLRKRTLAVALNERRSLNFSLSLIVLAYTALLLLVVLTLLPPWVLVGMIALPIALNEFKHERWRHTTYEDRLSLHRSVVRAFLWTGSALALTLWLDILL